MSQLFPAIDKLMDNVKEIRKQQVENIGRQNLMFFGSMS